MFGERAFVRHTEYAKIFALTIRVCAPFECRINDHALAAPFARSIGAEDAGVFDVGIKPLYDENVAVIERSSPKRDNDLSLYGRGGCVFAINERLMQ